VYFLLIVAIGAMLYMGFRENTTAAKPLTINQVALAVQNGEVARIIVGSDDTIRVVYKSGAEEGVESRKESATREQLAPGVTTVRLL
jgi:hypothetical protein